MRSLFLSVCTFDLLTKTFHLIHTACTQICPYPLLSNVSGFVEFNMSGCMYLYIWALLATFSLQPFIKHMPFFTDTLLQILKQCQVCSPQNQFNHDNSRKILAWGWIWQCSCIWSWQNRCATLLNRCWCWLLL